MHTRDGTEDNHVLFQFVPRWGQTCLDEVKLVQMRGAIIFVMHLVKMGVEHSKFTCYQLIPKRSNLCRWRVENSFVMQLVLVRGGTYVHMRSNMCRWEYKQLHSIQLLFPDCFHMDSSRCRSLASPCSPHGIHGKPHDSCLFLQSSHPSTLHKMGQNHIPLIGSVPLFNGIA